MRPSAAGDSLYTPGGSGQTSRKTKVVTKRANRGRSRSNSSSVAPCRDQAPRATARAGSGEEPSWRARQLSRLLRAGLSAGASSWVRQRRTRWRAFRFPGERLILAMIIVFRMIPVVTTMIPLFIVLGPLNRYAGLIIAHIGDQLDRAKRPYALAFAVYSLSSTPV